MKFYTHHHDAFLRSCTDVPDFGMKVEGLLHIHEEATVRVLRKYGSDLKLDGSEFAHCYAFHCPEHIQQEIEQEAILVTQEWRSFYHPGVLKALKILDRLNVEDIFTEEMEEVLRAKDQARCDKDENLLMQADLISALKPKVTKAKKK